MQKIVIMLNGSFGVGKTTVAKLLRRSISGSSVYDPELAGLALQKVAGFLKLRGSGTDDFQDLALWRGLTVKLIRLRAYAGSGPLIVPMAFCRRDYFDEVVEGLRSAGLEPRIFCLTASLSTIRSRLRARQSDVSERASNWLEPRIVQCAEAHRDTHFGEPINTEKLSAQEVAEYILKISMRLTGNDLH